MLSGPSSITKQSALLCNSLLRKSCACSQVLHYSPPAALPRSQLGWWCGTLGLDRHGPFLLNIIEVLFHASLLNDKVPLHHIEIIHVSSSSQRKLYCRHPFLTLLFYLSENTYRGILCVPKAVPSTPPLLSPRAPKGQQPVVKGCSVVSMGQLSTSTTLSGAQQCCWAGLVLKYCLRCWKVADGLLHITVNQRKY